MAAADTRLTRVLSESADKLKTLGTDRWLLSSPWHVVFMRRFQIVRFLKAFKITKTTQLRFASYRFLYLFFGSQFRIVY